MARKFKFISPGIFLQEVDQSILAAEAGTVGPVVIGRTRKGPSLVPVRVNSYLEFVEKFGTPVPGPQTRGDIWRTSEAGTAPTYAAFAAQAWLANNSPCTVVRLAGATNPNNDGADAAKAGWNTAATPNASVASNGGAYGLFIWNSGSINAADTLGTGSLAAVWYLEEGAISLTGTIAGADAVTDQTSSAGTLIESTARQTSGGEWKLQVHDESSDVTDTITFNFDRSSGNFARSVFNTSPVLASQRAELVSTANKKTYWLGETFETNILRSTSLDDAGTLVGAIMALKSGSNDGSDFKTGITQGETGWFIGQDLNSDNTVYTPEAMPKLFKFKALPAGGEWDQANIKVSIQDLAYSIDDEVEPYGSFTIVVRDARDSDQKPNILESYTGVNLNPNSPNYIARRVGDKDLTWDANKRLYREDGNYGNISNYITVEVADDVENGDADARLLPFGFYGPPRYKTATLTTNTIGADTDPSALTFITSGTGSIPLMEPATVWVSSSVGGVNIGLPTQFPSLVDWLRISASAGAGAVSDIENSYFGVQTNGGSDAEPGAGVQFNNGYLDMVRQKPNGINSFAADGTSTELSFIFTLDDIKGTGPFNSLRDAVWLSGSRKAGTSITAVSASEGNWKEIIDAGIKRFTAPLFGGSEGVDIHEMDPFNNTVIGTSETTHYEYNSVRRAIDSVGDAERVQMNLLAMPGIDTPSLTEHMINVCEGRGDALAIIDLEHGYTPRAENSNSRASRVGNVTDVINAVKGRKLNSSYGCAYYPWVQILDSNSEGSVWLPPSVAALGTFASSEQNSALWFAPAGFNRGGLTEGSSGLTVVNVDGRLTSKDRDNLYAVNVNPIASFPAEGIVIFGQKTLQLTASALDRINVRRLLIFVKREISRIASSVLFEQNVQATWNEFSGKASRFLESVKIGGGLTEYKVVLDETTTTPDLVDRNIMYAKVFLKPARAIEFIAVDFFITRSGASFED